MINDTLRQQLARRPFEPFHVVTSSGQTYDVRHPDAAILLKNGLAVAYGGPSSGLPEHVANLSLLHITAVESLPLPKNGRKRSGDGNGRH